MPKQKAPKGASAENVSSDARFENFSTSDKYRLPSKKQSRIPVDKRFSSRMRKDEDFTSTAKIDRYGRKLDTSGKKKALQQLYGSGSETDSESEDEEDEEEVEVESDGVVEAELEKVRDAARGGGFSSSEDEDEDEIEEEEEAATFPDMQADQAAVEMGEVSNRIAVVNMDWDNIKSTDLMAVFNSFVKPGGSIHKISIYPSEFGKERMEREELEGPPKEIFARPKEEESDSEIDSEDEDEKIKKELQKADDGQDFDGAALRQYQLERLRYYYAVVLCSDTSTAQNIYESTDGTMYLSSANFFDLRFIPDGVTFDDKARDECTSVPADYRPTEFVTDALQHSKVKLTWDMDPEEATRKDAINRAFSGSMREIGENDLRAYLGSDSESESEPEAEEAETEEPKLSKKDLARQKMRAALGLGDEPTPSSKKNKGPVGDMEVTFTGALTGSKTGVFENEPVIEETTAEAYKRKEKERKARRKEKAKAKREGRDPDASADEEEVEEVEDKGFDDPFFSKSEEVKDKASKSLRKADRLAKREAKAAAASAAAGEKAKLELLMAENSTEVGSNMNHFDMDEIRRVEKKKRKSKGKGVESKRGGLQEGFEMDVDERFAGRLFENHEFAIDRSNPKYKETANMKKVLDEGRKRRERGEDEGVRVKKRKVEEKKEGEGGLSSLIESVKKKSNC